jgi:hypothetical protein
MNNLDFQLERVTGRGHPYDHAVAFETSLKNNSTEGVAVLAAEFDLWQVSDMNQTRVRRMGELRLDPRITAIEEKHQIRTFYKPGEQSHLILIWHASPEGLQEVEDFREGKSPIFQIQSHFLLGSKTWLDPEGKIEARELQWEWVPTGHGWPLMKAIPDVEWLAVLDTLKFKHCTLDRLKWPTMPSAFSRAEKHLADAWRSHRTGHHDASLSSCYKAFECLGFDLYNNRDIERKKLVELLMEGAEPAKVDAVLTLMRTLQDFFHLGRHDRKEAVTLGHLDSQLAVACATTLMSYLAPNYKRGDTKGGNA